MTFSEQTALLLEALDRGFLQPDEIIQWADAAIAANAKPLEWLIDLSTLAKPYKEDIAVLLREHAAPLPLRRTIELVALAWSRQLLSVGDALSLLFKITMLDRDTPPQDRAEDTLRDVLVEWDCQEDLHRIPPTLQTKAELVLRHYLTSGADIARFVPLKCHRRPEPGAPPNGGPGTRLGNSGVTEGPPSVS
jgi:hypothetical protein